MNLKNVGYLFILSLFVGIVGCEENNSGEVPKIVDECPDTAACSYNRFTIDLSKSKFVVSVEYWPGRSAFDFENDRDNIVDVLHSGYTSGEIDDLINLPAYSERDVKFCANILDASVRSNILIQLLATDINTRSTYYTIFSTDDCSQFIPID